MLFSKKTKGWLANRVAYQMGLTKVQEMDYLGIRLALRKLHRADFSGLLKRGKEKIFY